MRILITGATGFVGTSVVAEMLRAGHQVIGLARSDASAKVVTAAGAEALRGDLRDLEILRRGAAMADAVIHAAFDHDFSKFTENAEVDRGAIEAMGGALEGSERPFVVTSGLPLVPDRPATEEDMPPSGAGGSPRVSEQTALSLVERGVRALVVRMSQVHDTDRQGFASYMLPIAREKGVSAYIGEGSNRWSAVHRLDTGSLYRLALENGVAGAVYHAVGEEGIVVRDVAAAIGRGLNKPVTSLSAEKAAAHFGWLARPVGMDARASSALTRARLGWQPVQSTGFLANLEQALGGTVENNER